MKLLIGIATYQRIEKLNRLLGSLNDSRYLNWECVIVADNNDTQTLDYFKPFNMRYVDVVCQPSHRFVIGAWNRVVREYFVSGNYDGFIGLCDDVELDYRTLEYAVMSHKYHFPDGDGVVGFNQDCPGHPEYTFKWFGQTLMGRKFVERYKEADYQICCPDYKHFYQDEEMYEYAMSLGKFHCEPMALLHHYHPSFIANERDSTHDLIRVGHQSPRSYDMEMQVRRKHLGLLWGQNFNLLGDIYG